MNCFRKTILECVETMRSDDFEGLCESHGNRSKKKKGGSQKDSGRPSSGHSDRPKRITFDNSPTPVGPNAEQNFASLRQTLSHGNRLSQGKLLRSLVWCLCEEEMENLDDTRYFCRGTGINGILRVANHRGHANEFARRKEWTGNYGIVANMSWRRFAEDKRVDYKEEVYMPQDMTSENEIGIVDGIVNWMRTGQYTGPDGCQTNVSVCSVACP